MEGENNYLRESAARGEQNPEQSRSSSCLSPTLGKRRKRKRRCLRCAVIQQRQGQGREEVKDGQEVGDMKATKQRYKQLCFNSRPTGLQPCIRRRRRHNKRAGKSVSKVCRGKWSEVSKLHVEKIPLDFPGRRERTSSNHKKKHQIVLPGRSSDL